MDDQEITHMGWAGTRENANWWLVTYPSGVQIVEWMDAGTADVKARATGHPVERVKVMRQLA